MDSGIADDRLRLIFTCCHPALALEVAGGARAADAVRADDGRDRPRVPGARGDDGQAAGPGQAQDRRRRHPVPGAAGAPAARAHARRARASSTCCSTRATRRPPVATWSASTCATRRSDLARLLAGLVPDDPEARGLLALLLLQHARAAAAHGRRRCPRPAGGAGPGRVGPTPRSTRAWPSCAGGASRARRPVPAAGADRRVPRDRADAPAATDWVRIVAPVRRARGDPAVGHGAVNRAVAVGMARGPQAGLDALRRTPPDHPLLPAVRADLLRRLGRPTEAADGVPGGAHAHGQPGGAGLPRGQVARLRPTVAGWGRRVACSRWRWSTTTI